MKLHVRRVWMDDLDELIPEWFNFVGVVHDLPLRFSREALPQGKECLAKKCFEMFAGTASNSLNILRSLVSLRIPPIEPRLLNCLDSTLQ